MNKPIKTWGVGAAILIFILSFIGIVFYIRSNETVVQNTEPEKNKSIIEYSTEPIPATVTVSDTPIEGVETGKGDVGEDVKIISIDGYDVPTVESVESSNPVAETEDNECGDNEECGRGATYPSLNISSPQAFANDVLGKCIDVDGHYGAQCWDLASAYFLNYAGRILTTCGTGSAKGTIADGCWQKNAGNEFTMVWDKTQIQPGDIAVYSSGQWGHIGMAMGTYNNGYFTLLGQNQGGKPCNGGGSSANIINLSTKDFIGAFRPNIYIKTEPETPSLPVSNCVLWHVQRGDTMSKIMMECEGTIKYGEIMNEYAKTWYSLVIKPGQSVYDGWTSPSGVGLYEHDDIEHRVK